MSPAARRGPLLLLVVVLTGFGAVPAGAGKAARTERPFPSSLRPYVPTAAGGLQSAEQEAADNPAQATLRRDDFYDPDNPDLQRLQRASEATQGLPKDVNGFPDWMRALRDGAIQPRAALASDAPMSVLDLDVIMKDTKQMPYVRFPHKSHTLWLDCSNCHPQPFEPRAGATRIAMADIFRGKYCGMCHDHVAFVTFLACPRCHSVPQETAAKR